MVRAERPRRVPSPPPGSEPAQPADREAGGGLVGSRGGGQRVRATAAPRGAGCAHRSRLGGVLRRGSALHPAAAERGASRAIRAGGPPGRALLRWAQAAKEPGTAPRGLAGSRAPASRHHPARRGRRLAAARAPGPREPARAGRPGRVHRLRGGGREGRALQPGRRLLLPLRDGRLRAHGGGGHVLGPAGGRLQPRIHSRAGGGRRGRLRLRPGRPRPVRGEAVADPGRPGPRARSSGAANRERVERMFRWERCVDGTRRVYETALEEWRRRGAGKGAR